MLQVFRDRPRTAAAGAAVTVSVALGVLAGTAPGAAAAGTPATTTPVPAHVLLGTVGGVTSSPGGTQRVQAFQSLVGRPMAPIRMYATWDSPWPDSTSTWARGNGQTVFLSVKSKTASGAAVPYAGIAGAVQGDAAYTRIVQWAQAVKGFGGPVMFTYNHEPEAAKSDAMGSATDYVAAWRKIVTVFRQQGVTNAEYVFIGTDYGWGRTDARSAALYYPGDAYVDDIGADAYNWYTCRPQAQIAWRSLQAIIEPLRLFGLKHPGKGLVLPEIGTVEDPGSPARKAQWYSDARALFAQPAYAQLREVGEWYGPDGDACDWRVNSSSASLDAFRAWGADARWTALAVPPAQPRQVQAATGTNGVRVTWAPAGTGGSAVTSHKVLVRETGQVFTVGGTAVSYLFTAGTPGSRYSFSVRAVNAAGTGVASAVTAQARA